MVTPVGARPKFDMTKPRSMRPMIGLDIEKWRSELNLSKYDAQYALGFRNSNHYNRMCASLALPVSLELLIRLYEESPIARGWEKYTLRDLFLEMYGKDLEAFAGTKYQTYATVDLGTRFCKFFDRSPARQYQWLGEDSMRNESELNAYSAIECILAKLKQINHAGVVLERVAKKVWALRGVDLDEDYRVPTPSNPPTRKKTGRKSRLPTEDTPPKKAKKVVAPTPVAKTSKKAAKAVSNKAAAKRVPTQKA